MTARNWRYTAEDFGQLNPFGSVLTERFVVAEYSGSNWSEPRILPLDEFRLSPAAHCLHYGSSCFEGLKAYRWEDDTLVLFRPDQHAVRMSESARRLRLPIPDPSLFQRMVLDAVAAAAEWAPPAPGALYIRPVLIGTDPNIGAASSPSKTAMLYVLTSPVGNYFADGEKALRLLVEDKIPRTTPQFGRVKTGANYAAALGITLDARDQWQIDQILFCPGGDVQETGASNFVLIDDRRVITKPLSDSFLHGVTRDSVLTLAAELGYEVQQRDFTVDELLEWTHHGEAALSGTAAVLAGVGTLIYEEQEYTLQGGKTGPNTRRLRKALEDIQQGEAIDKYQWLQKVEWPRQLA